MSPFSNVVIALADPTRREIFERLAAQPQSVGALALDLPISRPAVSQHLRVLKRAGLVSDRAEGAKRVYQIDPAGLSVMRQWLDRFWERSLDAFRAEADRAAGAEGEELPGAGID
ncbi:MAG: ArsR/SmtB family transcription factor [Stellaceae bacterium]